MENREELLTEILKRVQQSYVCLIEVERLTKELGDALSRNDRDTIQILLSMRRDELEKDSRIKEEMLMIISNSNQSPELQKEVEALLKKDDFQPEDFEYYTTYENSCHSKPNPAYYRDILDRIGCEPSECLMVGNDVTEDMVAESVGMKVFLLTDCLINSVDADISTYPNGSFDDLMGYIKTLEA